jgi:hypothetical protein
MYVNITRETLVKNTDGEWEEQGKDEHHKVFLAKVGGSEYNYRRTLTGFLPHRARQAKDCLKLGLSPL